jgi:hypothetical protein
MEADLNEEIKAAFERVVKEYDARADAAKQQREQELAERQQFEAGYQHKRDEVILPALRFVTTILEPPGWICKISDSAASTKFEVFRGNMRGASTARPYTSFQWRRWVEASHDSRGYANSSGAESNVSTYRTHGGSCHQTRARVL